MTQEDKLTLIELKKRAPNTWRCSSIYYEIASKYGIASDNRSPSGLMFPDLIRDRFIDQAIAEVKPTEVRFVLADSFEQLLKDFAHFYGCNQTPVEALQAIEKIDSSRAEKSRVRIVKVTFEELP